MRLRTVATVATEAKSMEESFAKIEDYWTKKGAADATGFAKQAVAASADIAKAGAEGDFAAASTAMMALGGTCGGCHMAHRVQGRRRLHGQVNLAPVISRSRERSLHVRAIGCV